MRLLAALLIFLLPLLFFHSLGVQHASAWGLLFGVALAWITEVFPVGITALLIPILGGILGLIDPKRAFESFGADIIFLIICVCLLARAFETTNLGKRLAYSVLTSRFARKSLRHGVYSLTFIGWFIGMWMVNSAVCSILLPVAIGILGVLRSQLSDEEYLRFSKRLLLLCSVTPGLSGLATPVGAAPNLFAFRYLSDHGNTLTFSSWVMYAAPVSMVLVLMSVVVLDLLYPTPKLDSADTQLCFQREKEALGALTFQEKVVSIIFVLLVLLWLLPPTLPLFVVLSDQTKMLLKILSPTNVGVLSILPLFLLCKSGPNRERILTSKDLQYVDLNTILLFGGGLTLGGILESSGLAPHVATSVAGFVTYYPLLTGMAVVGMTLLISEFCSNTAAVALVLPLVGSFSQLAGDSESAMRLTLLVLFAGTLGFALPAGTVPNGLVYSTGRLAVKDFVKSGLLIDLLGMLIILLMLDLIYPLLGLL